MSIVSWFQSPITCNENTLAMQGYFRRWRCAELVPVTNASWFASLPKYEVRRNLTDSVQVVRRFLPLVEIVDNHLRKCPTLSHGLAVAFAKATSLRLSDPSRAKKFARSISTNEKAALRRIFVLVEMPRIELGSKRGNIEIATEASSP